MARSDGGGSEFRVPATDRIAAPRHYDPNRRNRQGDHREQRPGAESESGDGAGAEAETNRDRQRRHANPNRWTLFDLLFDEVDATPEIDEAIKRRLKDNVRRSFRRRTHEPVQPTAPPGTGVGTSHAAPHQTAADDLVHVVVPAEHAADTEHLIRLASEMAEDERHDDEQQVRDARLVASQLRYCLSQHTETALKVSTYLRALMVLTHGNYKPKLVIEV